ncbi:DUF58 domain-containing protein [Bacteroidales bacterium OttesenSCG-928-B11]|nr:DUF58 domain-containing protein [Bacteroidales bacterium OttesenSCG-928-E04]MDL2308446.1 DUF58 domain-containing protein [Bacteroidales bacterium OttesenSCG-928-C03]MDL2311311.1 DUF58 domain-containing protein [Bacteroidales bacterium OttesenSCG-928-B11]MDL2326037.1 DUF58 domain-containing protein [Bacteroidales bacterium OttesenSCG-928-A14]
MDSNELIRKVRKIEIRTKALSHQIFQGQYHSAFKGLGMAFSEVRQYGYGDDVRFIDWNVTARFNQPYVKIFEEERELTVVLLIDVSGSNQFGTQNVMKSDLITELAAVLSFSAIFNNDKVGVVFFSDKVEKFIPPKKGRSHILRIISELVSHEPTCTQTNVSEALRYLTNAIKKKCTAFLISDFIDTGFEQAIRIAANKHDLVALNIIDRGEDFFPNIGLLNVTDPETGKTFIADTSNPKIRIQHQQWWRQLRIRNNEIFKKAGVDAITLHTDGDYVKSLTELFQKRS